MLKDYFSKFGEITNAYIIKKPGSCESRGFGYVTFATERVMKVVLSQSHKIDGREVAVESFLSKEDQKKNKSFNFNSNTKPFETDPKFTRESSFVKFSNQIEHSNDHFVMTKKGGRQFGKFSQPPVFNQSSNSGNKFSRFQAKFTLPKSAMPNFGINKNIAGNVKNSTNFIFDDEIESSSSKLDLFHKEQRKASINVRKNHNESNMIFNKEGLNISTPVGFRQNTTRVSNPTPFYQNSNGFDSHLLAPFFKQTGPIYYNQLQNSSLLS